MKKILSLLLVITLMFTAIVPAYASEEKTIKSNQSCDISKLVPDGTSQGIIDEMERIKAREMASIYEQLVMQGAEDMLSEYEEMITYDIINGVLREHNLTNSNQDIINANKSYKLPNGGSVQNITVSGRYAISTYYDFDDSYYFVLSSLSFKISDIVTAILGYSPYVGTIFSAVSTITSIKTSTAADNIKEADGYAKVTNLRHPETGDPSSIVTGWYDYPYGSTYAYNGDTTNLKKVAFPVNNPFEND